MAGLVVAPDATLTIVNAICNTIQIVALAYIGAMVTRGRNDRTGG